MPPHRYLIIRVNNMSKDKKYSVSKKEMVAEHKRIVPELKSHGLKKEAVRQQKELKEIKKK